MNLTPGKFYWVLIAFDPDTDEAWVNQKQPARFVGYTSDEQEIFQFIGRDSDEDFWPVRWIGEEIK